jgi:hypothetical protein
MATKKSSKKEEVGGTKEQEALPQFNYRHPGEPETVMEESKETPGGQRDAKLGSAPKTRTEQGLSEMAGMSEEKSQKDIDNENTWSPAR